MEPARSLRETLFLGCRTKRCCSYYTVFPTGHDVWRIATALQVPPWTFTSAVAAEDGAADAFALDDSGRRHRLALARREASADGLAACTFLVRLRDGTARCGLGDLRPGPCRSFPAVLVDGMVFARNDGGCRCRAWTIADCDVEADRALLERHEAEQETYRRVVANWNDYATGKPAGAGLEHRDFCRYLLDMYMQSERAEA
jgi:Fe-S-cluster containining protein